MRRGLGWAAANPGLSSLYQVLQPTHQWPVYQSPYRYIVVRCFVVFIKGLSLSSDMHSLPVVSAVTAAYCNVDDFARFVCITQ